MKKNLLSWEETLFRDPDVFELNYVPEQFDYRDEQTETLAFAIRPGLRGGKILDTVCRGPPSTGKTTSVKKIFEEVVETTKSIVPVYVNCRIDNTEYAILTRIYTELTKFGAPPSGTSVRQILDFIGQYIQKEGVQPLVCLDDANYLIYDDHFNEVLYPLSRIHETYPGIYMGLIVIISDPEIDLLEKMDVRVQSTFHPEIIHYPPYSAREMAGILDTRVKAGLFPHVFPPDILDKVVEHCMAVGDVRMGLNLIKRSVLYAERAARKVVSEEDLDKAIISARDSQLSDLLIYLSNDEKLVLKTAAELFTPEKSPTTKEIINALPPTGPKLTKVSEIFNRLEKLRLIDLEYSNAGSGRRRFVHIHGDFQELLRVLSNQGELINQ
ncbi:MAG TPA: ORC1-type DNA replication protein [Methanocorpusculum sp.]|nr:ORC1-type DNA replication protein [Methanocorpusculum sp.]HJJ95686.1 ORC1-type DNA replication protein [Methanocorpusculum sp.]